jgi:hypothetical protein
MKNPSLLLPALLALALPARSAESPVTRLNVIHIVADYAPSSRRCSRRDGREPYPSEPRLIRDLSAGTCAYFNGIAFQTE